jgi:Mn-dependent DtxR family transcriptional regulator
LLGSRRIRDNRRLVEEEVQKLVDAGLVCVYDGDHLRLTEEGLRVAEQLRREERSAAIDAGLRKRSSKFGFRYFR